MKRMDEKKVEHSDALKTFGVYNVDSQTIKNKVPGPSGPQNDIKSNH